MLAPMQVPIHRHLEARYTQNMETGELSCQFVVLFHLFMENNVPMQHYSSRLFLGDHPGGPPRAGINDGGGLAGDAAG